MRVLAVSPAWLCHGLADASETPWSCLHKHVSQVPWENDAKAQEGQDTHALGWGDPTTVGLAQGLSHPQMQG